MTKGLLCSAGICCLVLLHVVDTIRAQSCGSSSLTAYNSYRYLSSPGYPNSYSNNKVCIWTIHAYSTYGRVKIDVIDSRLEDSSGCRYDYVKVYDGRSTSSPLIRTWCGTTEPVVQSSGRYMTLKFRTDSSDTERGFRLKYLQIGRPAVSLEANLSPNILTSPGYPSNYADYMDSFWRIFTLLTNLKIEVLETDIQSSSFYRNCPYDYLKVIDGYNTSAPLLGKLCGNVTAKYYSSGRYVTINFYSNSYSNYKGFKLQYTADYFSPCGEKNLPVSTAETLYLTSPDYPSDYPSSISCMWRIDSGQRNIRVEIHVLTSYIDYSTDCREDYVEAFDGYDDSYQTLGKWCGESSPLKESSGRYMYLKFKTDSFGSNRGFRISYTAISNDILPTIGSPSFSTGPNTGPIVGGVVGALVFIAIICIIVVVVARGIKSNPVVANFHKDHANGPVCTVGMNSNEMPNPSSGYYVSTVHSAQQPAFQATVVASVPPDTDASEYSTITDMSVPSVANEAAATIEMPVPSVTSTPAVNEMLVTSKTPDTPITDGIPVSPVTPEADSIHQMSVPSVTNSSTTHEMKVSQSRDEISATDGMSLPPLLSEVPITNDMPLSSTYACEDDANNMSLPQTLATNDIAVPSSPGETPATNEMTVNPCPDEVTTM